MYKDGNKWKEINKASVNTSTDFYRTAILINGKYVCWITKRELQYLGLFFVDALREWSTGGTSPSCGNRLPI
jgi:hypothetical protein